MAIARDSRLPVTHELSFLVVRQLYLFDCVDELQMLLHYEYYHIIIPPEEQKDVLARFLNLLAYQSHHIL